MSNFPYGGYAGRYLRIDLTHGVIQKNDLPLDWVENYLGGNGIGTRILWDEVPPSVNPFSPENKLIVATGPLCGSPMPNSGRLEFVAKSPLTGIYGDSNSGGHFGPELKFAGYDLIIFEGRSDQPVYVYICDGQVCLYPADEIWGKGIYDTEIWLKQKHHDSEIKVAAIGPAGENLVRYASIQVTYRRSAARSGIGAVMGSKNLKAIAVRGHNAIRMHDPQKILAISEKYQNNLRNNHFFKSTHLFGTSGLAALMNPMGRFPTQNFRYGSFEFIDDISGETLRENHLTRDTACFNCPLGCDKIYSVNEGEFKGTLTTSVEYETLNALGSRVCVRNLSAVLKGNELCDDLGMDTISAGNAISFAMELFEKGILEKEECDDLDLSWGNYHTMLELLTRIAYRKGMLGDLLAEGAARAAKWIGRGSDRYAMHVKGQDIPSQDGRAQQSMGLAHATSSRGADHLKAFPVLDETGTPEEALKRYEPDYLPELVNPLATKHKALLIKDGEDYGAIVDSSGNCKSGGTFVMAEIFWQDQCDALQAITGMELDETRLRLIGERIYNLQRCYNAIHGITKADDTLPWRFTSIPSPSGNARGSVCHLDTMLENYYYLRGWDPVYGLPTRETLERLGLHEAALQLEAQANTNNVRTVYSTLGWAAPCTKAAEDPL